jgi:hypothetical protein
VCVKIKRILILFVGLPTCGAEHRLRAFGKKLLKEIFGTKKGKGKVIPVLFLSEHHAMKAYRGVEL